MNESQAHTELTDQEAQAILERLARPRSEVRSQRSEVRGEARPLTPPLTSDLRPLTSELALLEVIECLPDAVIMVDAQGRIVLLNRQTEQLFGFSREQLLGRPIEVLVPERLGETHAGYVQGFFREPRVRPMGMGRELNGRRSDGSEFPVEISLSPVQTEQGLFATAVIRDVSQRKREEAKLRTLVENIPAVTFIAPLDESVPELYVSPQIEQLLGFSQKEWLEDPVLWYRQLHPDDRQRWSQHFAPTCSAGTPFKEVYRFIAKDGRVVWVHGLANMVRDPEGQLLFLQAVAFDISSIKEAEEERERFFSLGIDLLCVIGLDGFYKRVNQAFVRTLGFSTQELLSRPVLDFVHPEDRAATQVEMQKLGGGAEVNDFENRCLCRDGSYRWLQWTAVPYLPRQLIYAIGRDVTEQKMHEQALSQLNADLDRRVRERTEALARTVAELEANKEELEERKEELEQFTYVSSHDLKEPLRTMVTYLQMLSGDLTGKLDEKAAGRFNRVINAGKRMQQLLDALSQYSRLLRRDQPISRVHCAEAALDARNNLEASIEESKGEVHLGELPEVDGNRQKLTLLFQNLIGNALKFRHPERPIRIEVGAQQQQSDWLFWVREDRFRLPHAATPALMPTSWLFWVKDNGIGMEARFLTEKDRLKVFGLGKQLHPSSRYGGTGFGLAICDKIVTQHGGRIWATARPGQGSVFYFTLPS